MRVCLPTPPTNKPHTPEGQTSRRCCSLLGVPVALTELAEEERAVPRPSDELISTLIPVTFEKASALHAVENQIYICKRANTLPENTNLSVAFPKHALTTRGCRGRERGGGKASTEKQKHCFYLKVSALRWEIIWALKKNKNETLTQV